MDDNTHIESDLTLDAAAKIMVAAARLRAEKRKKARKLTPSGRGGSAEPRSRLEGVVELD